MTKFPVVDLSCRLAGRGCRSRFAPLSPSGFGVPWGQDRTWTNALNYDTLLGVEEEKVSGTAKTPHLYGS